MARKFVCAYYTWLDSLKKCDDAQFGRIVRAALRYGRDGTEPSFPEGSREEMVWGLVQAQIDTDFQKYAKKSSAGSKGMASRWNSKIQQDEVKTPETGQAEIADLKKFLASMESSSTG